MFIILFVNQGFGGGYGSQFTVRGTDEVGKTDDSKKSQKKNKNSDNKRKLVNEGGQIASTGTVSGSKKKKNKSGQDGRLC